VNVLSEQAFPGASSGSNACLATLNGRDKLTNLSRRKIGLTLVELMVALLISIIIIGATFFIYQTHSRSYFRTQAFLEQDQNLRTALHIISRDIRMAGNGFMVMGVSVAQLYQPNPSGAGGKWFVYETDSSGGTASNPGVRAIFGVDNDDRPDTLTIFRADIESTIGFGQLRSALTVGANQLTLTDDVPDNIVGKGDVLGVVNNKSAILVQANPNADPVSGPNITLGPLFRPESALPSGVSFPAGSFVYNLRRINLTTYWVDTENHNLMASYHHLGQLPFDDELASSVIVAPGIEDFQVRYVLNTEEPGPGTDGLSLGALENNRWVREVNIGLVSRSTWRQPYGNSSPVTLFNHAPAFANDGFFRQVMTNMVYLRNY
jgi:type II secretory pathway pseudopilin PulG